MTASYGKSYPAGCYVIVDPEQQGEGKLILDRLRSQAKVKTFDRAMNFCEKGRNAVIFLVANNPTDSQAIWVFDAKRKLNYWVSKSHMDKIK